MIQLPPAGAPPTTSTGFGTYHRERQPVAELRHAGPNAIYVEFLEKRSEHAVQRRFESDARIHVHVVATESRS